MSPIKIKDVQVDGTQQQSSAFKTVNTKANLGARTEVDVAYIGGVPSADGSKTSEYLVNGAVYGMNIFVYDSGRRMIREDFAISKYLWNIINDNVTTVKIDGQDMFSLAAGDLVVKVFRENETNWVSPGSTENGQQLANMALALKIASGSNILEGAVKS